MKKLIAVSIIFLLLAGTAFAGGIQAVIARKNVSSSCDTAAENCIGDDENGMGIGEAADKMYISSRFLASKPRSRRRVDARLIEVGTFSGELTACIYTDDGSSDCGSTGCPNAVQGTCSTNTIDADDIPGSYGDVSFTGLSTGELINGAVYHVVIYKSSGEWDASNYVDWGRESTECAADGEQVSKSADGSSWASGSTSTATEFQAYE
jgi:hypothetical protein